MDSSPTPFDSNAPLGSRRAIIRRNPNDASEIEMVEAAWGSNPRFSDGASFRFVRSEGRTFPSHRCLVPASEFQMRVGEKRYRVTLDGGNHFYLAAIWEPAMGEWPVSRSEEHTSELQSLMRISYAVFCLKKKKLKQDTNKMHCNRHM